MSTVDTKLDEIGNTVLTEEQYNYLLNAELLIRATIIRWDDNDTKERRRKTVERIQEKARQYNKDRIDKSVMGTTNDDEILLLYLQLRLDRMKNNDDKHFDDSDYKNAIDKLEVKINNGKKDKRQEAENKFLSALEEYKALKFVTDEVIQKYIGIVDNYSFKRRIGSLVNDLTEASLDENIDNTFSNFINYMREELIRDLFKIKITDLIILKDNSVFDAIIFERMRFNTPPSSDIPFKNYADDPEKNQNDYISILSGIYDKYEIILKFWKVFDKYENIEFVDEDNRSFVYSIYNTYVDIIEFYKTLKPTKNSEEKIKVMEAKLVEINRSIILLSTSDILKLYKLFKNSCGIVNDEMKDLLNRNAIFGDLLEEFKLEHNMLRNIDQELYNKFNKFNNINENFKIVFIIYYIDLRSKFLKEFSTYLFEIGMSLYIEDPEKWDDKVYTETQLLKYLNDKVQGQIIILDKRLMYNKICKENKRIEYVLKRLEFLLLKRNFSLKQLEIQGYLNLNNEYLIEENRATLSDRLKKSISILRYKGRVVPEPEPEPEKNRETLSDRLKRTLRYKGRVAPEPEFSNIVSQQSPQPQQQSMLRSNRFADLTQTSKTINNMFAYSLKDIPHFYNIINYVFSVIMNGNYQLIERKLISTDNRSKYYNYRDIIKTRLRDLRSKYIVLYKILSKYEHKGGRVNKSSNKNNVKKTTDPKKKPTTDAKKKPTADAKKKPTDPKKKPTKKPTKLNRGADMNMKDIRGLCKVNQIKLSKTKDGVRVIYTKKELITKLTRKKIL